MLRSLLVNPLFISTLSWYCIIGGIILSLIYGILYSMSKGGKIKEDGYTEQQKKNHLDTKNLLAKILMIYGIGYFIFVICTSLFMLFSLIVQFCK